MHALITSTAVSTCQDTTRISSHLLHPLPSLESKGLRHHSDGQRTSLFRTLCHDWSRTGARPSSHAYQSYDNKLVVSRRSIPSRRSCLQACLPAVTNTRSAPFTISMISSLLSSAAFAPTAGLPPAPSPLSAMQRDTMMQTTITMED